MPHMIVAKGVWSIGVGVKGQIDQHWSDWFENLAITHTEEGETVLTGTVIDEAAMYGLLSKLRDLGLQLLSVNRTGSES
ncbi:hypothetical protein ES703_61979 [subsurface metagenome]